MQQNKFTGLGNNIMGRMDEMGKRMDELEQSIVELMEQAGLDRDVLPTPSSSVATAEI